MSPRPQIDHIRRPQLLAAAADVIAERGLAATRIADVAERVGTSSAAVLYWFSSKDELLAEALIADEERFADDWSSALAEIADPAAKLLRLIDACVDDNNWTLWIEIWARARHDDRLRRARQQLDDDWRGADRPHRPRRDRGTGTFAPANADEAALDARGADRRARGPGDARRLDDQPRLHARASASSPPTGCSAPTCAPPRRRRRGGAGVSRALAPRAPAAGAGLALGAYGLSGLHGRALGRQLGGGPDHQAEDRRRPAALQLGPVHGPRPQEAVLGEVRRRGQRGQLRQPRGDGDQAPQRRRSYDLIWPSTEYVYRLNKEGLLAHFDRGLLRNNDNISSFYDSPWWDPNNDLGVPYTYYTTGIAWREDEVSGMTGSWNDLMNPDGAGRMFILDDFQEAIGEANLLNGFDLNTEDSAELEQSKQTLLDQKENARGFSTNSTSEPGLGGGGHPPGVERRHRQRPQPGRRPRALPVRDLRRRASRSAPT